MRRLCQWVSAGGTIVLQIGRLDTGQRTALNCFLEGLGANARFAATTARAAAPPEHFSVPGLPLLAGCGSLDIEGYGIVNGTKALLSFRDISFIGISPFGKGRFVLLGMPLLTNGAIDAPAQRQLAGNLLRWLNPEWPPQ